MLRFWSLTNENSYAGLSASCLLNVLKAIIVSDVMEDIKNALFVLAVNRDEAMEQFFYHWQKFCRFSRNKRVKGFTGFFRKPVTIFQDQTSDAIISGKKVTLLGEIFVRRISSQ